MRVVGDEDREYLTIQILHNDMTVMIPRTARTGPGFAR